MPSVVVPKEFFVKERNQVYSNWQLALWRELFSNSIDAGAKHIWISITHTLDEKRALLSFEDDGKGMDRNILENVYFRLGASTKDKDKESVGGFGRARILTSFSHHEYFIESKDLIVIGDGGNYDIYQSNDWVDGCRVTIVFDKDVAEMKLRGMLSQFINESELPVEIHASKEEVSLGAREIKWEQKQKLDVSAIIKDKTVADIFYLKKEYYGWKPTHNWIIRVNGCSMYAEPGPSEDIFIIELRPEFAREMLTASRDSIREGIKNWIESFKDQIRVSLKVIVKRSSLVFSETYTKGRGTNSVSSPDQSTEPSHYDGRLHQILEQPVLSKFLDSIRTVVNENIEDDLLKGLLPDIALRVCSAKDYITKREYYFNPTNWRCYKDKWGSFRVSYGYSAYMNYLAWDLCISQCLNALSIYKPQNFEYVCGFVLDEDVEGMFQYPFNGVNAYFFNPLTKEGQIKFDPRKKADFLYILALAKHESTHTISNNHTEDFMFAQFEIDKRIDPEVIYQKFITEFWYANEFEFDEADPEEVANLHLPEEAIEQNHPLIKKKKWHPKLEYTSGYGLAHPSPATLITDAGA